MHRARTRQRRRRPLVAALLLLLLAAAAVVAARRAGAWLVVADPLQRAPVIAVLAGDAPFRAMEAAALFREGWAPEIWLTRATVPAREAALARFGIEMVSDDVYNVQVLERLGVGSSNVRVLEERVETTPQELALIARHARQQGHDRVILVTSRAHTRRVRATWDAVVGDDQPGALIRPAREDGTDLDHWWRRKRDAKIVATEWLGLANTWLGFPLRGADD